MTNPQGSDNTSQAIKSLLKEHRLFHPPEQFAAAAHIPTLHAYETIWRDSIDHSEEFWGAKAKTLLHWIRPFTRVLDWQAPHAKWFEGGTLNVSYNCIDRHLASDRQHKKALIWEAEDGSVRTFTYSELHAAVCQAARAFAQLGLKSGDRATIYMPLVPEAVISMLACARLGAVHNVVFAGFSSVAIADRNKDAGSTFVITADGSFRKGSTVPLKDQVDEAIKQNGAESLVKTVVVLKRTGHEITMQQGRDHWWHETVDLENSADLPATAVDSEHPLFLLYTSGSTGKPKGILHTSAGYLLYAMYTSQMIFDLKDDDVYWCTADVGWITGHTYLVYGPLANGATVFMYEGAPNYPDWGRFWRMIETHKISIFYTAPTAIRALMKAGDQLPEQSDLTSLRLLGSVGEPINPEAWIWYHKVIGGSRCPIVDTWWQTETGGAMIAPLPGATSLIPGSATKAFFGIDADVVDEQGHPVPLGSGGFLVIKKPWPGMLRTIWGDDERFRKQYWSQIPGCYFTGDGARRDEQGNFWIMGRIDDVINVSGHRLSTMEIESALVSHPSVAEAAVVGAPHELKGEAIHAFVTLNANAVASPSLKDELHRHVVSQIGALARPESTRFTESLPKTRSGKIMRRLLREIAAGQAQSGDITTLEDSSVLAKLRLQEHDDEQPASGIKDRP